MRTLWLSLLLAAAVPASASVRPCQKMDLVGPIWVQYGYAPVLENLNPLNGNTAIRFNADGTYLRVNSSQPFSEELLDRVFLNKPQGPFEVYPKGYLMMGYFDGVAPADATQCNYVTAPAKTTFRSGDRPAIQHQTGDIGITYYNAANNPRFLIFFRRRPAKAPGKKPKAGKNENAGATLGS